MPADHLTVVVDRIEGDVAVLEVPAEFGTYLMRQWLNAPASALPPGTVEGERLVVRFEKEAHRG